MKGDEVPIIGRIGDGMDGVVAHKRVFSDRLTEYLIDEVKPVPERSTIQQPAGPSQIVGQQMIVYNVQRPERFIDKQTQQEKPVIDVTPK